MFTRTRGHACSKIGASGDVHLCVHVCVCAQSRMPDEIRHAEVMCSNIREIFHISAGLLSSLFLFCFFASST